jgi:hypothetical protein
MTGSYELRDLDHATVGQLYEGKLVIDKTYGHAAYGCGSCCGYNSVQLSPDPFGGPPGIDNDDYIYANDTCSGDQEDVTDSGYDWASSDTAVATLPNRTLHTVAIGSATGSALAKLQWSHPPSCPTTTFAPTQPVSVTAVPVNFHLTSAENGGDGVLGIIRNYAWQSSDGSLNDLSTCSMRENVTYPTNNNSTCPGNSPPQQCYYPASPPWAGSGTGYTYPNPTIPPSQPATGGTSTDTNAVSNLNFVKPYKANSFAATQYVQYSCSGGPWTNLYGPVTITRSVSQSGSQWIGTVSATDTSVTSTYVLP